MTITNFKTRQEFRKWLTKNHNIAKECWIPLKSGKPIDPKTFYYIDAIEEALCFGWIDSIHKLYRNKLVVRFSPRRKNSVWTELNKERVRRLDKLGLMTKYGKSKLPKNMSYHMDKDVEIALKKARVYSIFKSFPSLYQRIRGYNVAFYKSKDKKTYIKALEHLIKETKRKKMFGEWNDYGRLLDY